MPRHGATAIFANDNDLSFSAFYSFPILCFLTCTPARRWFSEVTGKRPAEMEWIGKAQGLADGAYRPVSAKQQLRGAFEPPSGMGMGRAVAKLFLATAL